MQPLANTDGQPSSLIEGVEQAVCAAMNIKRLRHRSALHGLELSEGVDVPNIVHDAITRNWISGRAIDNKDRSRQNWRWEVKHRIGQANYSPEVMLERAIAQACIDTSRSDWTNQVPVASGLVAGAADGRRAIDLIQKHGDGDYELIELKIGSDTPLYAAIELLGYASLWLLARRNPPAHSPDLLKAHRLRLRVLAPSAFYAPFDVASLERSIDRGVRALGTREGVEMTFGYDVLPDTLVSAPLPAGQALIDTLSTRRALHDNG